MRVCFWGQIADALNGKTGGGGELQIALMAKTLASLGNEVVVVDLEVNHAYTTPEGIKVSPVLSYNNGIRGLRTFTHRLPGLYSTFVNINADIYYCRIREYRHIIVYWAARKVKGKFILGLASDLDILSIGKRWKHFYSSNVRDLWGAFNGLTSEIVYPFLLRKSDCILVQHIGQQELLKKKHINSVVFPNVIDTASFSVSTVTDRKEFVYVGSLDKRKGFADFFEVVKRAEGHFFKVIGNPRDKTGDYYYQRLRSFENVDLAGRLTHEETIRQISCARALISTSPMEGFPNVFIEAWACGVPVISLYVDPGNVIERERLGINAHGDINELLMALDQIEPTTNFAERTREYVQMHHELNTSRIREIEKLFNQVYENKSSDS